MNLTIDLLRRRCRRNEVELDDAIPSFLPGPGVNDDRVAIREQVYAALAQLTPEHRAVLVLKEIEDLHCHEIAEILNISLETVLSRLFYGRKNLQSILRPLYNQMYESQRHLCDPQNDRQGRSRLPSPSDDSVKRCVAQDPITPISGIVPPVQRTVL
jgi:hypothetical protein